MYNSRPVELEIHCQNLVNRDTFSRSDPVCHVWLVDPSSQRRQTKLGQTEQIADNLNPRFRRKIQVGRNVLPGQLLEFVVQDDDVTTKESLGKCYMTLDDILRAGGTGYNLPLGKGNSRITVFSADPSQGVVKFMIRGMKIKSKDFLSKSDPFLILKQNGAVLYQTEHCDNTKSPQWKGFDVAVGKLDFNQTISVECFDYDGMHARPDLIGTTTFVPAGIANGGTREFTLISNSGKQAGAICVDQCQLVKTKNYGAGYPGQKVKKNKGQYNMQNAGNYPMHNPYGQPGGYQQQPSPYGAPPPAHQPGYPQPGYPPAQQPGYSQPAYAPAQQPGYPPTQQPGYPPAQQPGYPPAQQPGYPPAHQPGYPPAQPSGYPANPYPANPYPTNNPYQPPPSAPAQLYPNMPSAPGAPPPQQHGYPQQPPYPAAPGQQYPPRY